MDNTIDMHLHEDDNYKRIDVTNQTHNTEALADPFTLSWLGITFIEGVIGAIGAMVFNEIFADEVDMQKLLVDHLKSINQVVRDAISDDAVRRCQAQIDAITLKMKQYNNATSSSKDRLIDATEASVNLWAECKSLGYKAILPFTVSVGIQIAILQERIKHFHEVGENKNIVQLCQESSIHLRNAEIDFVKWSDSRFELVELPFYNWTYKFNGEYFGWHYPKQDAIEAMRAHQASAMNEANEKMNGNYAEISDKWLDVMIQHGYKLPFDPGRNPGPITLPRLLH